MNTLVITLIIVAFIAAFVIVNRLLIKEEDLIKKAQKNYFYHVLAKMTCPTYDGYINDDEEKKAIEEYLTTPSEYDNHPIGSYFKLSASLRSTLSTCANFHNYKLNFNLGEVGTGVAVLAIFGIIVTLGVMYG